MPYISIPDNTKLSLPDEFLSIWIILKNLNPFMNFNVVYLLIIQVDVAPLCHKFLIYYWTWISYEAIFPVYILLSNIIQFHLSLDPSNCHANNTCVLAFLFLIVYEVGKKYLPGPKSIPKNENG